MAISILPVWSKIVDMGSIEIRYYGGVNLGLQFGKTPNRRVKKPA
jgi:hypothetical protein